MVLTPNLSGIPRLVGDNSPENITLTPGQLASFPGGVWMLGGNDTVRGSSDSERIFGNDGKDSLLGGTGNDSLYGGKDDDDVLDINAQFSVRQFLREYNERYQATVLLTSHYMADITALCKRVLLIHEGQLVYDGSLDGLLDRFAPYRQVQVELAHPLSKDSAFAYGEVESIEGNSVRFLVRREELTVSVSKILAELEVIDLTITDPPIEEVIGRVFRTGKV